MREMEVVDVVLPGPAGRTRRPGGSGGQPGGHAEEPA